MIVRLAIIELADNDMSQGRFGDTRFRQDVGRLGGSDDFIFTMILKKSVENGIILRSPQPAGYTDDLAA